MKLKNVSCTQFAGVLDKDVDFSDGINVIYGKNESGKSTIVNLISRTLFQNSKIDGRKDKEFKDLYFPSAVKGKNIVADFADGKLVIEADDGTYTLTKEWGVDSRVMLRTPDGVIRDENTINEILKEKIVYGEGVYNDMLLSSQHNMDLALQTLLDANQKTDTKQEITDIVSKAFAQGDGISIDLIEEKIKSKIEEIEGKHWDNDRQMPVRKATRWSTGLGEILKAYYKLEDAQNAVENIKQLQSLADISSNEYNLKNSEIVKLEKLISNLEGFSNAITLQKEYEKNKLRLRTELEKYNSILESIPKLELSIKKAKSLKDEYNNSKLIELYNEANGIIKSISRIDKSLLNATPPLDSEIANAKSVQNNIAKLQNQLCAMNINATIKMLGNNKAEIRSIRTNEIIEISDNVAIKEAVKIIIPDVMEMSLAPADVDINCIEEKISEQNEILYTILRKYKVSKIEELEKLANSINNAKSQEKLCNEKLAMLLGDIEFEELENFVENISNASNNIRDINDIISDIISLCASRDVDRFIISKQTILDGYINEYESIDKLKIKAFDTKSELDKINEKLSQSIEIPAEFTNIDDPQSYVETQKSKLNIARESREQALKSKTQAMSKLEIYMTEIAGDPYQNVVLAKQEFEEQKELLQNWLDIYSAFLNEKQSVNDNPMVDISNSFEKYLGIISNGRVETVFPQSDKLQMDIYSNNHILNYDKLSEGTKETVALAFRLAVIDHLFPNGNGFVVFDDPFIDMDKDRIQKSCELIRECAKNNQVVVMTCKEEYIDMLGGNLIRI